MKRLIFIVEGQTEEEFVNQVLAPYFVRFGIHSVSAIKIATSSTSKGGFVNYEHLKNDIMKRIRETNVIVTTFIDYFRMPTNMPKYELSQSKEEIDDRIHLLEKAIEEDISFIAYIQKHEFEALLFSSNVGFENLYNTKIHTQTAQVIVEYQNPENINTRPDYAPSKRLISIMDGYEKVFEGNMIALEVGIDAIIDRCPRFKNWIENLIERVSAT